MLNELRDEIYSDAVAHGLWDGDYLRKTFVNSDVLRDSGLQIYKIVNTERELARVNATFRVFLENQELLESVLEEDHFAEELADVIITALSAAGYLGIDIDKAVRAKMEINRGREWRHGQGRVVVTGVRWAESGNRKKNQGLVTFTTVTRELHNAVDLSGAEPNQTSRGGLILNTDNDESRRMVEMCYRTHKTLVNPIVDWTDEDVWEFIKRYNVPYCELYDFGFKRLGCVACPLGGSASMQRELEFFPQFKKFYIRAFDEMLDARRKAGKHINRHWTDGESVLRWWVGKGGESKDELQLGIFDETEESSDEM